MTDAVDTDTLAVLREVMEDDFDVLVQTFLDDARERIPQLRSLLAGGDCEGLRQMAHSLKGSSGNLGAAPLSALCFQVEQCAKDRRIDGLEDTLAAIETEFQRVTLQLQSL